MWGTDHRLRKDPDPNSRSSLRLRAGYLGIDEDSAEDLGCKQANDKCSFCLSHALR